jgi:uncharacterized low-complexity protein
MRHIAIRTLGITAVAAAALAFSGAAWAQQAPKSSSQTKVSSEKAAPGGNCVQVRSSSGNCIKLKSGSELMIKESSKTK